MTARTPMVAGNVKMNLDRQGLAVLLDGLIAGLGRRPSPVEVVYCPPFTLLRDAFRVLEGSGVGLGAQNLYWEEAGAYTGEVSAAMLLESGCGYVIVGHSERRSLFGETDKVVSRKARAVVAAGMIPIVCVGENQEERDRGQTFAVLSRQIRGSLENLDPAAHPVIAYEPVWAIGTGRTATPGLAQEAHAHLRKEIAGFRGKKAAEATRILYGGSVKPENAAVLIAEPDIDGSLVGGASLKAETFLGIVWASG